MNFTFKIARACASIIIKRAAAHPYTSIISVASLSLGPILGTSWLIAMPLKAVGFGSGGVAGGSVAAWYQSVTYGGYIPVGSVFAWLQHLGAVL